MPAKLTAEDYHRVAREKGVEWLGEYVPTTKERTLWRCRCGREWETSYGSMIKNAGNCPGCGGREKKSEADYYALAEEFGFVWVGPMPKNAHSKSTWRCSEDHEWETSYVYIKQGYGCPHCAGVFPRTPEDYHALAAEKAVEWLGPKVPNVDTKTKWRCEFGHEWETIYYHIFKGYGCPVCAGNIQKTAQDYRELALLRGFIWLGPEVSSIHDRTWWQCHKGHEWEAVYASISHQGTGCPKCADFENGQIVSQPQRKLFAILTQFGQAELNAPYGRLNIDIALIVNDIQIAVEYDCWYWHKDRLDKDAERDQLLIADGWRVLRVKSRTKLPTKNQLKTAVNQLVNGRTYVEIILSDWGE